MLDVEDMGLAKDNSLLRFEDLAQPQNRTFLVGVRDDGNGIHIYQTKERTKQLMVCAIYRMDGRLIHQEQGVSLGLNVFTPTITVQEATLHPQVSMFCQAHNIGLIRSETIETPQDPVPPYAGPVLGDLTLPLPF